MKIVVDECDLPQRWWVVAILERAERHDREAEPEKKKIEEKMVLSQSL